MNDQAGGAGQPGGGEAPDDGPPPPEELRGLDLSSDRAKKWDLTRIEGLLPEHLAGTILTGRALPPEIAKFEAVAQVKAISSEARKLFIALLAACVYCWLVIGTTTDVALILNTASSPLPIINTPIPIAGFYVVGAALLAAVYCYFHFYLFRLWRTLATLPAVFPDGVALDDKTDPWLLTNLVRTEFPHLRATAPPLARLENLLTIVLAWWLVPLTLVALWARYLPAHDIGGLTWLAFLIAAAIFFGRQSFHHARATLAELAANPAPSKRARSDRLLINALKDVRHLRPDHVIVWLFLPFFIVMALSGSALVQSPRDAGGNIAVFSITSPWQSLQQLEKSLAKFLNFAGIRTYANLREVEVAARPENWEREEDWSRVRRVDLRDRNLAFADAPGAFLANADLRGANLTGVILAAAELRGASLFDRDRNLPARLGEANLQQAQLQGANLQRAQLQGANLEGAQLQGTNLDRAQLQGANLTLAQLQGADLTLAQLQGADLQNAQLEGADLVRAQLQGADLRWAQLQGADLTSAQFQGADVGGAALWRAVVDPNSTSWDLADLRGAHVTPMEDSAIDGLIAESTTSIPDEEKRKRTAERLTSALRTEDRPERPHFPGIWASEPNVVFWPTAPAPKPLAEFLGGLACGLDVPEAQIRGIARRAVRLDSELWDEPTRLWFRLFAERVLGPDCPPAEGLPEDWRRWLERLAAELKEEPAADAALEAVVADPGE